MFFNDAERARAKLKTAAVRDCLNETGSLTMNPFFKGLDAAALGETFARLAENIEAAAKTLSKVAGIDAPAFEDGQSAAYLANGFAATSRASRIDVEVLLSNAFQKKAVAPWEALQDLERQEAEGQICPETARQAMDGLAGLHAVARAVPEVYKIQRQAGCPALAVA